MGGSLVGDLVRDLELIGAGNGGDFSNELKFGSVKEAFINGANDSDPMRWFGIDPYLVIRSGNILNLSVEGEVLFYFAPAVVDELILPGMPGEFQATANHPFIESFEPTKSAPALQVDVGRVYHFLYRGIPAQSDFF